MKTYITRINGRSWRDKAQYMQYMTAEIALQLDVREMGIYRYDADAESVERRSSRIDGIIAGMNRGDIVICQFPTGNGLKFESELVDRIMAYGGRTAIFVHELEAFTYEDKQDSLQKTVRLYNRAEVLIVPTFAMRQWLLENGIRKSMKFVVQEMWDYTVGEPAIGSPAFRKEIYFTDSDGFAGMNDWNYPVPLKLYNVSAIHGKNIQNLGGGDPYQLLLELSLGGFGLIWYKDEYSRRYMEYGTSFSLARYLAAGIPIIVPMEASERFMIEANHLGLAVDSLEEAASAVEAMTESEYQGYVHSVEQFAPALRNGYYTKRCLIEAMAAFYRSDAGRILLPKNIYHLEDCEFTFAVLKESYGGNLALSWSFRGNPDGFLVYDVSSKEMLYDTKNIHQHYALLKGSAAGNGFSVMAYLETLRGKLIIAESAPIHLCETPYDTPKVSLIMPAYNAEDYIVRSIDTALAQSLSDLEIIIVDDGSTDHTPEIIDWYAEKYVNVVVIHQENGGVPAARNTGIKHAKGEYIGFMDNDDMLHPDMAKRLYNSAKKNNCEIAITSVYQITNNGYEVYVQHFLKEDTAISVDAFFRMLNAAGWGYSVVVWNKLYRSSLVKERLFPLILCDDSAWTPYILSYADRICYLNDYSYEYDRIIRHSTLVDEWRSESKEDRFMTYKNLTLFYLENGNPKRIGLLKECAKKDLASAGRAYAYNAYDKLWQQIDKRF